jgi:predicted MFS family arabinose efflux permease
MPSGHLRLVAIMLAGGAVGYALLAAGGDVALVLGTVLAFALGWGWVGVFFFAVVRLNPDAPGAATGIVQTGDFAGSLVGPVVFGSLAASGTYRSAWFVAAALAVLGAVVTIGVELQSAPAHQRQRH